ncbi:replication-relaxation family protein [Streptomyces sp. WMMC1477]|uniref:replication-relaxation family protein n=1 Tax=Streptomyces sp. WMMC1477 TaxID=3015155 RepID=UPI0022B6D182|nr:replication-relaxation family protein [Streptomyces sp. WMMC1477]MCZ7430090.1 replication-relaxation family protein [Streptomyces sp. WMMC1477]
MGEKTGGKRKTNPGGSSNPLRADVLRVLGVLKVATADQIQRLTLPHLTFRHTDKESAAKQKEARTAAHRGALRDLRKHGLTLDGGSAASGETLRSLTPAGLEAAATVLGWPMDEMGGTARGAGRSGAPHAMAVNETVLALIRPKPDLALLDGVPDAAWAAAKAAVTAPDGIGSIDSFATEVPLPPTGTWTSAGKGGAQADAVLAAPESGVPLLFIEVDNCNMDPARIAAKFDKYARFLKRKIKDTDGRERAMWRTRWPFPDDPYRQTLLPPVLLVFNPVGQRDPQTLMNQVAVLTRPHWQGRPGRSYTDYDGKIPIVATTMDRLREHGPAGPAFWRFGRRTWQPLTEATGNPRQVAAEARRHAEDEAKAAAYRAEQQRREAELEREAQRPVCASCGAKFTDARWKSVKEPAWDAPAYPQLCDTCERRALDEEQQRSAAAEQQRQDAEAESRVRRGLFRRRS